MKVWILVVAMLAGTAALVHADPSLRSELLAFHNYLYHVFLSMTR